MLKRIKKDNKGISILELLLVMVITMIILAMILVSYNLINRADVTKSARRLENAIKTARVASMSKGRNAGKLQLIMDGGNLYASIEGAGSRDLIAGGGVFVDAVKSETYGITPADAFGGGLVMFETSGILRMNGVDDTDRTSHNIFALRKGNKCYVVTIYAETGAVVVEEIS
ncbi:MAG: prepilin-type N-terminal cleavage/methylation domain-containing protein [Lachnospiraceae bacterium]|nr:prepilin-type N-terminal cleavage/methylation domain-containing protein [Lachnospiraceae bacterium]